MRVTRSASASALALGSALLACVTPPPPEDSSSSGLALYLDARSPLKILPAKVDQVLFIRLDEQWNGEDAPLGTDVFYSNYSDDGYFYLLNPPPGRYVAVAAVSTSKGYDPPPSFPTYSVGDDGELQQDPPDPARPPAQGSFEAAIYFSEELVRQSQATARPGSLSFMGEFVVHTSILRGPDTLQAHYFRLFQPGESGNFLVQGLYHGTGIYSGRAAAGEQGGAARDRFSHKAAEHLTSAGWGEVLKGAGEGPTQ